MDDLHRQIITKANLMELFANGDKTFKFGEFKRFEQDVYLTGTIPNPEEYKKGKNGTPS